MSTKGHSNAGASAKHDSRRDGTNNNTAMHYIIEDTETGGLYPAIHAILSIAAVCSWNDQHFYIHITPESQPGKIVDPEAVKKNGYSAEKWAGLGAVPLDIGFGRFLGWLAARRAEHEHASLWCHNLAFDRGFLSEAERITGLSIPHRHDWRCSQSKFGEMMDHGLLPRGSGGLDRLIELSAYSKPRTEVHDALEDCYATLHGLRWLIKEQRGCERFHADLYNIGLTERNKLQTLLIDVHNAIISADRPDSHRETKEIFAQVEAWYQEHIATDEGQALTLEGRAAHHG